MKFASKLVFALTAAAALAGFSASASADPGYGRHHHVVVAHHHHYFAPVRHHHHR